MNIRPLPSPESRVLKRKNGKCRPSEPQRSTTVSLSVVCFYFLFPLLFGLEHRNLNVSLVESDKIIICDKTFILYIDR